MEKPTFSISFSEYSTFQQCPHKWFLNYVLKIPSDTNEELIFGSSMHDSIEKILTDKLLLGMSQSPEVVETVFKGELKNQIQSITDIDLLTKMSAGWVAPTFTKQAKGLFQYLNLKSLIKDYDIADVEIKLDGMPIIETDEVILTYKGFIDLVLRHKVTGRYLIIDWKTSRVKWKIKDKELDHNFYTQLKLYKHFYALKKGIPLDMIDLAFYNLPREVPQEQDIYPKHFDEQEIVDFINDFREKCKKIYYFDYFKMDKMRFTTKKNFCSRCPYNKPNLCDDRQQFQHVDIRSL